MISTKLSRDSKLTSPKAVVGSDNVFVADAYFDGIDGDSMVEEITNSTYLQTEWEFDVKDYPVQVIAGARYEETEVTRPGKTAC